MSVLNNAKREMIVPGAAYLLTGILMCLWPVGTTSMLCVVAGAALLAVGVIRGTLYFRKKEFGLTARADFMGAAVCVIIGAALMARPDAFIVLVPFILGMMILVNSIFLTQTALELRRIKYAVWWRHLVVALVCAVAALVMMFNPFGSYRVIAVVMGVAFIADGAADLWTALYLKGKLKKTGLL